MKKNILLVALTAAFGAHSAEPLYEEEFYHSSSEIRLIDYNGQKACQLQSQNKEYDSSEAFRSSIKGKTGRIRGNKFAYNIIVFSPNRVVLGIGVQHEKFNGSDGTLRYSPDGLVQIFKKPEEHPLGYADNYSKTLPKHVKGFAVINLMPLSKVETMLYNPDSLEVRQGAYRAVVPSFRITGDLRNAWEYCLEQMKL